MKTILKSVYKSLPFKRAAFSMLKSIWTPPESIYKHLHFTEPFTVRVAANKSFQLYNGNFIENEIFWEGLTGKWEKESMKLWIKLCNKAKCVIDIGANSGVYALVAKAMNQKALVAAFEPHPVFYKMLEKNVLLNRFNIQTYNMAVSDTSGEIKIDDFAGGQEPIQVSAISLDDYIMKSVDLKVDLIKIDVETFEPQVMEGFKKYLPLYKPAMLIEILNGDVADAVQAHVNGLGYLYFNIDENGGIRQTHAIERSDYYNYLICSPEDAKYLELI